MHHQVGLDEHARAARHDIGEGAFIAAPCPAEQSCDAPERRSNLVVRGAERLRVVGDVGPHDGHARIECDLLGHLRHRVYLPPGTTSLTTGRHLLDFVRGTLSTSTNDTSMFGRLADAAVSIAPRLSSPKPSRGTMHNSTE